jgi:hypothetical protein
MQQFVDTIRTSTDANVALDWTDVTQFYDPTYACQTPMIYPSLDPRAQGAGQYIPQFLRDRAT